MTSTDVPGGRRRTPFDAARAEAAVRELLLAVGDDPERPGLRDTPARMYSTCEHHLVPFHGVAHIAYIPSDDGRVTGLSKLARLVDVYARRPQVRGIRKPGAVTTTSAVRGQFRDSAATRAEAMSLVLGR